MIRHGYSLLELLIVIVLAGLLLALAAPRIATFRDGASVRAAAGDMGALFSLARQTALVRRSATAVVLDTAAGVVSIRLGGETLARYAMRESYGVRVASNRDSAVYDARGLGYGVSNLSVVLRRGRAVDTLVMSRLGRVRW